MTTENTAICHIGNNYILIRRLSFVVSFLYKNVSEIACVRPLKKRI